MFNSWKIKYHFPGESLQKVENDYTEKMGFMT